MNVRDWFGRTPAEQFSPLSDSHRKRQALFAVYWNYYRGHHRKHIKASANGVDDNITINYSKEIVDQGISFLFGKEVTFEIDSSTTDRTDAEKYLDTVWGAAETKMTFLQEVGQNGAITGTPFVRLYPPDPNVSGSLPRLVNLEPGSVDVIVAEDNAEEVRAYHIVWKSGDTWKRHVIAYDIEQGVWTIEPQRAEKNRMWVADGEVEVWPYDFAPVQHAKNLPLANSVWGMSDLEDADLNDAINRVASNTNRIIRFHAHPKTIGTGFNASQLNTTSVNEFWTIEKADAKVANLEMQSDLVSSRDFGGDLKTAYHKVTSASELDPAQVNVGALSGFALKILYGPTLALTDKKRNTYGGLLKAINKALLIMGGYEPVDVKNVWKSPLPESGLEQAQELDIDRRNGLSKATYLERRGYDAQQEMEKSKLESDAAMEQQQAAQAAQSPLQRAMADLGA